MRATLSQPIPRVRFGVPVRCRPWVAIEEALPQLHRGPQGAEKERLQAAAQTVQEGRVTDTLLRARTGGCLLLASGRNDSVNTAAEESSDGSARRIRRLKGAPLRAGESSITTAPVRLCGAPPHFLPSRKAPPLPAKAPPSPAPRAPFLGWAFPGGVASGSPPAVGRRGRGRLVAGCAAVLARFAAGAPPSPTSQSWSGTHWSGRRDSNPRPSPWQGDALPLRHFRVGAPLYRVGPRGIGVASGLKRAPSRPREHPPTARQPLEPGLAKFVSCARTRPRPS